ncbi:AAA family ATPase [Comamonas sp. CAH-2]|uniref:AAA family ATPase n=1 Tax=Comamonas sp. CAH-2 TaxID=2605745 RepID=UPI001EEB5495|nr:AAA family ATPase [Comamonas sp. CAH-2]
MTDEFFSNLLRFAEAAMNAEYSELRKVGQVLAREISEHDPQMGRRFKSCLNKRGVALQTSGYAEMLPIDSKSRLPLIEEQAWPDSPIFLDEKGQNIFQDFLRDAQNFDVLASKGIASKLSLMLSGPPGTGKSLLAGHIAAHLGKRLYVVRLDSVISSLLGDTAKNIRSIFDFIAGKNAVLFLDELDAIAKMRDDRNELGELKRVVNTVIQGIDSLNPSTVLVAATNHSQMLDPAIWRRFSYKLEIKVPDCNLRGALWDYFLGLESNDSNLSKVLAALSDGLSGADIELYALAARRKAVINNEGIDFLSLARKIISEGRGISEEEVLKDKKKFAMTLINEYGLKQSEAAELLGVTRQSVSNYLK